MVLANEERAVIRSKPRYFWPTIACAFVLALGLAACGKKGPLDLPPGAAQSSANENSPREIPVSPGSGPPSQPMAPRGPVKRIPPDWLID